MIEVIGAIILAFATAAAIAWCKDWVVRITKKYFGKRTSSIIDWALKVIMFIGLGQYWIDLISDSHKYYYNLKTAAQAFGKAIVDTYWTVVEYVKGDETEERWEPVSVSEAQDVMSELKDTRTGIRKYNYKG